MIYTYPDGHKNAPPTAISVDSERPFDLSEAGRILNLSRCGDVVLTYTGGAPWWNLPEVGKLFDFLAFRGASIVHITGKYDTSHSAYLSARLEKLYGSHTLDSWSKV